MINKTEKDLWVEMSIQEIQTQAHFAEIAYSNIDPKAANRNDAVFSSIHSFLSHCAMVSKMLDAKDDGNPPTCIGDILGIPNTSLIHRRKFRNHLEHYDERLRKWIKSFAAGANIGTYNIGPKSAVQLQNMIFVSHYDPDRKIFTFVDEDFDLSLLFVEVQRIKNIADEWFSRMEQNLIKPPYIAY